MIFRGKAKGVETWATQRGRMVETQLRARGIADPAVLAAMLQVPRHRFVVKEHEGQAYDDHPLRIGCAQTISQPYIVGIMTELLELKPGDRVLEIGTGSGYQAAVIATIAREVVTVERHPELAEKALELLHDLGYANITVITGDGTLGYPQEAPYDAIIVTAGSPGVPNALLEQLAPGGRLVCPTGGREVQDLYKVVRVGDDFKHSKHIKCVFVPLLGADGWPAAEV